MQYSKFTINNRPVCVWDSDIKKLNSDFIKSIKPDYYVFIAESNFGIIEDKEADKKDRIYASMNLRIHYSMALETLFALICATLQAPDCISGWMLKYTNNELFTLVRKINHKEKIKTKFSKLSDISWDSIGKLMIYNAIIDDIKAKEKLEQNFSLVLRRFADDFLDKKFNDEFNSIKHGFRIRAGGFTLKLRPSSKNGVPIEGKDWMTITQSEYGSTYNYEERIAENKLNIRVRQHSRNWNPENIYSALHMISICIHNIRTHLCVNWGIDRENQKYKTVSEEAFKSPWKNLIGLGDGGFDMGFDYQNVKLFSKEEILSVYNDNNV